MVEELRDEQVVSKRYFKTQPEIQRHYGLKRSAVYFLINNKSGRKTNDNINVYELEAPLPVYNMEPQCVSYDVILSRPKIEY